MDTVSAAQRGAVPLRAPAPVPSGAPANEPPPVASLPQDTYAPPAPLTMVAVGDSLTAGMQDGICRADRQRAGYVPLVAAAAGIPMNLPLIVGGSVPPAFFSETAFDVKHALELRKALIKGVAPLALYLEYVGMANDYSAVWKLPEMGHRDPASLDTPQHPQHNFAVSGLELRHMVDVRSARDYVLETRDFIEDKSDLVVRLPGIREILQNGADVGRGSQIDQAIAKKPDVVLFWGGANDVLAAATGGVVDDRTLTPVTDQIWDFNHQDLVTQKWVRRQTQHEVKGLWSSLIGPQGALTRLLNETTAEIVAMNLPDVTTIPNLRVVGRPLGSLPFRVVLPDGTDATSRLEQFIIPTRVKSALKGQREQYPAGSRVGLVTVLSALVAGHRIESAADLEAAMRDLTRDGALTENDVLDRDELAAVQERIDDFNRLLQQTAARNKRIHLVDAHAMMNEIATTGRALRGTGPDVTVTTTFTGTPTSDGRDGMFSFDGFHPSNTGHAMIANAVLDRLRADLGANPRFACFRDARPVDEKAAYQADPHRTARPAFMLAPENVDTLSSQIGATAGGHYPFAPPAP